MNSGAITDEPQSIATSMDGGTTWNKFARNPVLPNPGTRDFQDLKVFAELATLRSALVPIPTSEGLGPVELAHAALPGTFELQLELDLADAILVTLAFRNHMQQRVRFRIDHSLGRHELDRSTSGEVRFNLHFALEQFAPLVTQAWAMSLQIFVDASSLEIFVNRGENVTTALAFPWAPFDMATLSANQPVRLISGTAYGPCPIWVERRPRRRGQLRGTK